MADRFVEREVGDLTIRIDRHTCIGSGSCIKVADEIFQFDDTSVCAFRGDAGAIERDRLIEACRVCPVHALLVFDAAGNRLVP